MFALVLAGELIYGLPYHLPRYYRPTLLEVFGLSYADLGDAFAFYGITAMISYFPGGILADRYSARKLMVVSLVATAAGGFYLFTLPGFVGLAALYAYWGVTTVLLFWCALIRATRAWGGDVAQGRGFGLLEGGRGLVGALFATAGVLLLRVGLGADPALAEEAVRAAALQTVILQYTICTLVAALVVRWCIPDSPPTELGRGLRSWDEVKTVMKIRAVWLQAIVVICAYSGYKGLDHYSAFAFDTLGMNEADAAGFSADAAFIRPIASVAAGIVGDRIGIGRTVCIMFASLAVGWGVLAGLESGPELLAMVFANLWITYFGVYALRGIFFALLEETRIEHTVTGAAVGVISLVGYTPDIFFGSISGRLLDSHPGVAGYQHVFLLLAGFAMIGLLAGAVLSRAASRAGRAAAGKQ